MRQSLIIGYASPGLSAANRDLDARVDEIGFELRDCEVEYLEIIDRKVASAGWGKREGFQKLGRDHPMEGG
jgi:hypothetical protein